MGLVSLTEAELSAINCFTADKLPLSQNLNIGDSSGTARTGLKLNCHPTGVLQRFASIPYLRPNPVSHDDGKNVKDETISTFLSETESSRTHVLRTQIVPNRVPVAEV